MIFQHLLSRPAATAKKGNSESRPFCHRPASAEMTQHEHRPSGGRREIDAPEVSLERQVIAEPLRLLVGIHVTAHPRDQGCVVDDHTVSLIQAQPLGQPQGNQALAQHVLHRLAHAQVGRQGQNSQQFGETDAGARRRLGHDHEYKPVSRDPAVP